MKTLVLPIAALALVAFAAPAWAGCAGHQKDQSAETPPPSEPVENPST